ncbi:MAG: hypothetical protein ACR2HG_00830 [Pyrinomonadaceae bacterium]
MKPKQFLFTAIAFLLLCVSPIFANAQTAPPFKVSAIKIVPYDQLTGEFEPEIKLKDSRTFFDEVALGLLITVEISGQTDTSADGRKVETTVLKGGKILIKKLTTVDGVGAGGKFYIPIYIDYGLCQEITVTAKIIGQKTASTMTRKVPFSCGE